MDQREKLFRDTVHGYIRIPETYCDLLIDTPEFQRLRRIEQTSMRVLYPCAHHDRFVHSLGTFHLGCTALQHIEHNSPKELKTLKRGEWARLKRSFEAACLLHDIGHSPFSHTFEKYYDKPPQLDSRLKDEINDPRFTRDLQSNPAAPHEKLSALILLKVFGKKIEQQLEADSLLAARMIIGCRYHGQKLSPYEDIANALITLLNSEAIDVDKLDYTSRDRWASGVNTSTVDLSRLLSSACIRKRDGSHVLAFYKNAISVIESVLDVRNYQHVWIFSHHKVIYDQRMLDKAVSALAVSLAGKQTEYGALAPENTGRNLIQEQALAKLFSPESFFNKVSLANYFIYLPTDDDLTFMMRQHIASGNDCTGAMHEWLYRDHKLQPIWKSYPEFHLMFSSVSGKSVKRNGSLDRVAENVIGEFAKEKGDANGYLVERVEPSIAQVLENQIFVDMGNGKLVCYTRLGLPSRITGDFPFFFYAFLSPTLIKHAPELVRRLLDQVK